LCISDIEGDSVALAAVLATAEGRGYSRLLCAGDLCFPGADPLGVWRRLTAARATCVQGVSDRAIATLDPASLSSDSPRSAERLGHLARVRAELGEPILKRLARLDTHVRIPLPNGTEALLVHGSPMDPTEPFTQEMTDDEIRALLGDDPADLVICGGSHVPFDRTVLDVRIVNVGSVGGAVYQGGRFADATFIDFLPGDLGALDVRVEQVVIPLDGPESRDPRDPTSTPPSEPPSPEGSRGAVSQSRAGRRDGRP
jgi:predicted phosphodiesterase